MSDEIIRVLSNEVSIRLGKKLKLSPLNGGSSNASLKAECDDGKNYVIKFQRYSCELELQRNLRKYVDLCDENHPKLVLASASENIPEVYITVSEWMEGSSLVLEDEITNISALRRKAQQAAKTVKMFHSINLFEFQNNSILNDDSEMDTVFELIALTKIDFPYRDQFFQAIQNGMDDICSPKGIVHMDLRPDNMVFIDDSCKLIDMETMLIDHIWADFSYAVEINFPKERAFYILFLESYFGGKIPDEFWKETRQQVLIKFLSLTRLSERIGNIERQYELAKKIYKDYDGFQSYKPLWMNETIKELQAFTNNNGKI